MGIADATDALQVNVAQWRWHWVGACYTENRKKLPCRCSVSLQVPQWHLPVVTGP